MSSIEELNALSEHAFVERLEGIFEHSPWVAEALSVHCPFADLSALEEAADRVLAQASQERQLALVQAHPDLAGKLAAAGRLTAESTEEQRSAGLDQLTDAERATFTELNQRYTERFGFPFIICVKLHSKPEIIEAFRKRLERSREEELSEALLQVGRIARLRLRERFVS